MVPASTNEAPALSTADTASGVASPPAAITGTFTPSVTCAIRSPIGTGAGKRFGVSVPECPPAALACTASMSTPAAAANSASAKVVTVWGEMFGKSPGQPDYQIYGDSIKSWDKPNDDELITPDEKQAIISEVCDYLKSMGRNPVVLPN